MDQCRRAYIDNGDSHLRWVNKRFVGQARVDSSFHTCRTISTHKLSTAKWHTMYRHANYPNV